MKVSLLTGGSGLHYNIGLLSGLLHVNVKVDVIGGDDLSGAKILNDKRIIYYNFRGSQNHYSPLKEKVARILKYYYKLIIYTASTDSKIFHIQWLNKFILIDRTLLNIYYKLIGKKLVFTAHNIDARDRDGHSYLINRLSLKFMYLLTDHIIVHTNQMKTELINNFRIRGEKISVIYHGINMGVKNTDMTKIEARDKIGIDMQKKVLLFLGRIHPYKGLEYLIEAFSKLRKLDKNYRLLITGNVKKGGEKYWENVQNLIKECELADYVIIRDEYIPDSEMESYFKAADVLILPYKAIFQSGLIFLSYKFGLPIIASNIGSFRDFIIENKTGLIFRPEDSNDLVDKIELYFQSDLYKYLDKNREEIIKFSNEKYSWDKAGEKTLKVYKKLFV